MILTSRVQLFKDIHQYPNGKKIDNGKEIVAFLPIPTRESTPMELTPSQSYSGTPTRGRQSPGQIWKRRARSGKSVGRATEVPLATLSKRKGLPVGDDTQLCKLARIDLPGDVQNENDGYVAQPTAVAAAQPRRHQ